MGHWREVAWPGLVLLLCTCGVNATDSLPANRAENAVALTGRSGSVRPAGVGLVTLAQVEAAVRADAIQQLRPDDPASLQIKSQAVTWSDGALGCPKPGMTYTQALQPGWRLVVVHQGREAVYHASRNGYWMFCPDSRPIPDAGVVDR